jgi:CHRD domain
MIARTRWLRVRVVVMSAVLVTGLAAFSTSPALATIRWGATLVGDQVVPGPGDEDATGFADLFFRADPNEPGSGLVCVSWTIEGMDVATSAEIGAGDASAAGSSYLALTPPDEDGFGGDCLGDLDPAVVQAIIDNPSGFFVQVRSETFPDGAVRGQIVRSAVVRVNVQKFVCPGRIRRVADLLAASPGTCTVAARTGDIGSPPPGFTWSPKPTEFDMQVELQTGSGVLTLDQADLDGGGTCGGKTCSPGRSYTWSELSPGPMTMTELTFPKGYKFGWATIGAITEGGEAPAATVDVAHHSISFDLTGFDASDGVFISIYDFRGAPTG